MEEGNGTVVLSSVTFSPVPEDDSTFLKCVGDNPKLLGVGQEDSFKLNVVCKYFTTSYTKVLLSLRKRFYVLHLTFDIIIKN